jgi:TatD family hydrolase
MHDTHVHLEMLLQKLELLLLVDRENFQPELLPEFSVSILDELLNQHDFVIQATTSTGNFLLTYQLFSDHPKVKFLVGSHPEIVNQKFRVSDYLEQQRKQLLTQGFLSDSGDGDYHLNQGETDSFGLKKIVGIGECGLDYHYTQDKEIIQKQWDLFESQLALASFLHLPVAIHNRQAFVDTLAILQKFPQLVGKFVFHCFTEGIPELEQVLNLGGYISVGGIVTFKNAQQLVSVVEACPLERLMIETDLPFLAPTPYRGQVCLPRYVAFVAEKIAEIKGLSVEVVWSKLTDTAISFWQT